MGEVPSAMPRQKLKDSSREQAGKERGRNIKVVIKEGEKMERGNK